MINKLKSEKGESIGEVLVAMLVVSLGSVMFASMVSASGKLITRSKKAYDTYIDNRNELESTTSDTEGWKPEKVKIELVKDDEDLPKNTSNDCSIENAEESVKVYLSKDQKKFIYDYQPRTTGADNP